MKLSKAAPQNSSLPHKCGVPSLTGTPHLCGSGALCGKFQRLTKKRFNALPGFGLTMGFTLFYLSAIVLIPFAALMLRAFEISWPDFWRLATTERALAAYRLTFGASLIAAVANAAFGTLLAWGLVRYQFP